MSVIQKRKGYAAVSAEDSINYFANLQNTFAQLSLNLMRDFQDDLVYGNPGKYYHRYRDSMLKEILDEETINSPGFSDLYGMARIVSVPEFQTFYPEKTIK